MRWWQNQPSERNPNHSVDRIQENLEHTQQPTSLEATGKRLGMGLFSSRLIGVKNWRIQRHAGHKDMEHHSIELAGVSNRKWGRENDLELKHMDMALNPDSHIWLCDFWQAV